MAIELEQTEGQPVMRNPLADVTASASPNLYSGRSHVLTGQELATFGQDQPSGHPPTPAELEALFTEGEAVVPAWLQRIMAGWDTSKPTAQRASYVALLRRIESLDLLCSARAGTVAQLEKDRNALLEVIERGAFAALQGSVTYLLLSSADITTWLPDSGDELNEGDEWARERIVDGRRRIEVWNCIERQILPGGNIICVLRPGPFRTLGQGAA